MKNGRGTLRDFQGRKVSETKAEVSKFMAKLIAENIFKKDSFLKQLSTLRFLSRGYPAWAENFLPFDKDEPISFRDSVDYTGRHLAWYVRPCLGENLFGSFFGNMETKKKLKAAVGLIPEDQISVDDAIKNFM